MSNIFASTGDNIIVPCFLAPLSEEICCPGASSALTTMRPNEAITASPTRKPVATTTPSSSPIKGTSKSPTPPNNNQGISGLFDPSIIQPTRPTSSYLGPPMLQSLSPNVPSPSLESSSVTMGAVETTHFTPSTGVPNVEASMLQSLSNVPSSSLESSSVAMGVVETTHFTSSTGAPNVEASTYTDTPNNNDNDDTVPPTQSPARTDMTMTMSPTNSSRSSSIVLEDEGSPTSAGTESRLLAVGVTMNAYRQ